MRNVAFAVAAAGLLGVGSDRCKSPRRQRGRPRRPSRWRRRTSSPVPTPRGLRSRRRTSSSRNIARVATANAARPAGSSLAGFDAAKVEANAETAEKMIRKLRAGMMPPPTARHPEAAAVRALVDSFESRIDKAAALNPNPGWRPFQRLNRAEYARAVRDLLGIDVDVNSFLPPDTLSSGFDNISDVQNFSPTLMEGYLRAASQISRLAVGDRNASPTSVTFKIGRTAVADAARGRRADGHARRHFHGARLPGRRRVRDPRVDAQRAARRHLRPLLDADDGHHRAGGRVGGRRARRAARRQSRA